jgi:hypothetical protein
MTASGHATSAGNGRLLAAVVGESRKRERVPDRARELAARLSALFERDVEIVGRLNDAQCRLRRANELLWSGLSPDAFGLVYDGAAPAGESQIAALGVGRPGSQTQLLEALQQIHWTIHGAFHAYRHACEERRQLAVEVGEVSHELTEVLCALGWSADDAREVDVHELAGTASDELGAGGRRGLTTNHGHGSSYTG